MSGENTMRDRTTRFALSALFGFFCFVVAVPVSCGGFVLLSEHRTGDVASGGPASLLAGMAVSFVLACAAAGLLWKALGRR